MMEEFGDALVKATVNDSVPAEDRATALALHDEGEALYDAGDDDQCVEKLEEALKILGDR
jgi:glyoxylase-like metal-dependent hydrolase (beta-lactamase superfamily II)